MADQFGRFELLMRLGGGAMGDVFLARQEGLTGVEKLVVVKTLSPQVAADDRLVAMFLDEARIGARLHHPNVCQTFDLGIHDGVLYVALEYIHGVDLAKLSADLGKLDTTLPVALAVRLTADVAGGLHHAHELTDEKSRALEIVHRDVSPSNILVTYDGGVKLCDFGMARATNRLLRTQGHALKGKVAYMAPEQMNEAPVDRRADVFALGVVLHELLTGKRLFLRPSDVETLAAVLNAPIDPPSAHNDDVPPSLDAIVLKALARDPAERYPTAQAFQLAMENWLKEARDPSSSVHLSKFVRQLYVERLETERRKGLLWNAPTGPVSRGLIKKPAPPPAPAAPAPAAAAPAKPRPVHEVVTTALLPAPAVQGDPRRRWIQWAAGVAVSLFVALVAWVFLSAEPSTVHFLIESQPSGARVWSDGVEAGVTPFTWRQREEAPRKVRLVADGHDAVEVEFTPESDGRVKVMLPPSSPK